jgi:hypothetical protein
VKEWQARANVSSVLQSTRDPLEVFDLLDQTFIEHYS